MLEFYALPAINIPHMIVIDWLPWGVATTITTTTSFARSTKQ
jgi:hypothetical protein